MSNTAYEAYRRRNNAASKRSRDAAKEARSKRGWVFLHPDMTPEQAPSARRFLDNLPPLPNEPLSATTRGILRKHLHAARAVDNDGYRELLAKLDAMETTS